jgi:ribonucleoside-diphosphate reductase alpha chain
MGLAINEPDKNQKTLDFYHLISSLRFVPSTPTLFHSGLIRAQLSSCFLTTVEDDLNHIFKSLNDKANLLKYSGGVATDWTNLRALGSPIKSIDNESTGLIPFLKLANDTTSAINRSGRRRGASVAYLEVWHLEIEDFLDLRRNVGDERRRTHELNLAA